MNLSAGAKKELLVLFFCKAMLQTALEVDTIGDIKRERANHTHTINNRLDRRIKSLMDKITATIDTVITADISDWMRSKTKGLLFSVLTRIAQQDVQLETFAMYVMFVNFCERSEPLHDAFAEYTASCLYFDNIDLLKKVNISDDLEADMMNLAYKVVAELKG